MRRSVKFAWLALATSGAVAVALAQSPSAAAPTAPPAATPAATPPAPPAAPPAAVSPERFEPTDKVRADFDVSFPIDI